MWILRLILIAVGLLFVIWLYFYTRRQQAERRRRILESRQSAGESSARVEPDWSRLPDTATDHPRVLPSPLETSTSVRDGESASPGARAEGETHEEKIFTLAVRLPDEGVDAQIVTRTLARLGCEPGAGQIYHCANSGGRPHYSVANLFEPGVLHPLPPGSLLRGLAFFFEAEPGTNAAVSLDRMLGAAHAAAERLGGRVLDAGHHPLTAARELELKLSVERNG